MYICTNCHAPIDSEVCTDCNAPAIKETKYVNLVLHDIVLNDGRVFKPSGTVARVSCSFSQFKDDVCQEFFGEVTNLPAPQEGTRYIVSALVLSALKGSRDDVVAPATGHPDCIRNDKGQIISVPGFVS